MQDSHPLRVWTLSNALSFIRGLLPVPVLVLGANAGEHRWSLVGLCILAWLTDISDGYIARRFDQESDFGRIIDPLADKLFVGVFIITLSIHGFLPLWYLAIVLLRDILIFAGGMYLKGRKNVLVQSNHLGKAAVLTIGIAIMCSLFLPEIGGAAFTLVLLASAVTLILSFVVYARRFVRETTAVS